MTASNIPPTASFDPHADPVLPSAPRHGFGLCACAGGACQARQSSRRLFTGLLGLSALAPGAWAREGVDVGKSSSMAKLVPAEQVEAAGAQQYQQMMREAANQRALAPNNHPQLIRLREIAKRIIPQSEPWNPRAKQWRWEVNLIASPQLNAFCMPGGKIAFYYGILDKLKLSDDEVATIMGHEVAHALREHARERMAKTQATRIGAGLISSLLGLGGVGDTLLNMGGQLLSLTFSREDESEADLVGMELAARAGYDPAAGISLWQKMGAASKGAPPQWLSTHPAGPTRIKDIQANLPKVEGLYARADKPKQRFDVAPALQSRAAAQ
ncbi:putative Zn-dependent protease [Paucibacter oligotrophus]|uniref:Putative Zn-dependent protease n=1 Tax=Roseateles oligotrophus TaxID=1769250 RepID=A0A840L2I6_9BURK|nr:M48 family metallopeptidase [Roseateles oligotrophus]MBB4842684.1 putative Zn-dependent protease [Roseateles oligotrophus]